jgi:hypothetical protein
MQTLRKMTGQWNWTAACGASGSAGRFQIVNQGRDGDFSGAFSNASPGDTGTINGKQRGFLVELVMGGRIEGPGGPYTFRATAGR